MCLGHCAFGFASLVLLSAARTLLLTELVLTDSYSFAEYEQVQSVKYLLVVPNKGVLGKAFKKDAQKIMKVMSEWSEEEAEKKYAEFEGGAEAIIVEVEGGQEFEVTKNMVNFEQATKKVGKDEQKMLKRWMMFCGGGSFLYSYVLLGYPLTPS